jgi:hypothetical protein
LRANDSQGERGLYFGQDEREVVVEANRPTRGAREGVPSQSASAEAVNTRPGWTSGRWYEECFIQSDRHGDVWC